MTFYTYLLRFLHFFIGHTYHRMNSDKCIRCDKRRDGHWIGWRAL